MPIQDSIAQRIQVLRARSERYKLLAETLYDRRIAEQVEGFADELEAELVRLERCQDSYGVRNSANLAAVPWD